MILKPINIRAKNQSQKKHNTKTKSTKNDKNLDNKKTNDFITNKMSNIWLIKNQSGNKKAKSGVL